MRTVRYLSVVVAALWLGTAVLARAADLKPIKMGLSMNQLDSVVFHAFADYAKEATLAEGKKRGFDVQWTMVSANGDVTKQANDIKDLLSKDVAVVIAASIDSKTILSSVAEVRKAKKYFVMYTKEAHNSATGLQIPSATVNMDSEFQAYGATVEMLKIMKKDGVTPKECIDVHGDIGDENAHNRERGFRKALAEFGIPNGVVAQVVETGHWEPEVALQNTAAALQAHPDTNCMYVSSDWLMSGVQTAMENAGKWNKRSDPKHVYLAGTDMYPSGIKYTIDRYMDGNVDVPAWQMAVKAAEAAFDLVQGKQVSQKPYLEKGTVINSDNAAQVVKAAPHLWGVDYEKKEGM